MPDDPALSPTVLDPAYFQQVADRWRLEVLPLDEVARWATVALTHGHDGRALRELAWSHDGWGEVEPLMPGAIAELGLPVPTRAEALARQLRRYAHGALAGDVPFWDGVRALDSFVATVRYLYVLAPEDWPPGFSPYLADQVLDLWPSMDAAAQQESERSLRAQLEALLTIPPTDRSPGGDAPALGGRHAPPEPEPEPAPTPEPEPAAPSGGTARFSFEFSFDVGRAFSWSWPPRRG